MTKPLARMAIALFVAVCLVVAVWVVTYPASTDPKSIRYVLWKVGLYKLNLDTATGTMIGDADSEKLVVGKTRAQLEKRFGPLLTADQASAYLRGCYQGSAWKNKSVLFIRDSAWMIVFGEDRATNLVLIKGC